MNRESHFILDEQVMPVNVYLDRLFQKHDTNGDGRLSKF